MSVRADGATMTGRLAALRELVAGAGVDALLVDEALDLRYVSGYTGSNGLVLVPAAGSDGLRDGRSHFLTDFRYVAQAAEEVPPEFERTTATGELRDAVPGLLAGEQGRLGFDAGSSPSRVTSGCARGCPTAGS